MKCPNCGSMDTAASIGDNTNCLNCGKTFNSAGDLVQGPDQQTKDIAQARLEKDYEPNVVGNYADLQRLGGQNAPKKNQPAFVDPTVEKPAEG